MPVIVRLRHVRRPIELGMLVVVLGAVVRMRPPSGFVLRRWFADAVTVRVGVPVHVLVPVRMGVWMAVHQIPVPVLVVVHVLVEMGVQVIVFVIVVLRVTMIGIRGTGLWILRLVRVIVGEALSVRHGELRGPGEIWRSPTQRPQPSESLT